MRSYGTRIKPGPGRLLALALVCVLLAGCGGAEPEPIVVVVTRSPETPTAPPAASPEAAPTQVEAQFEAYEHPSGAFRLDLPLGATVETDEDAVVVLLDDSQLLVGFTVPDQPLGKGDLEAAVPPLVDAALVDGGLIVSYSDLEVQGNQAGDAVGGRMAVVTDAFGEGEAEIMLWQVEHVLYTMLLVTPDYAAARDFWTRAMDSLAPSVEGVPLPAAAAPPTEPPAAPTATLMPQPTATLIPQPTATNPPPPATPRPQPTATPRPQPTSPPAPPPASGQGCYLFVNEIPAELTVTFTAQDRQWNDSFKVPANGTREYCLDPGRYTYTIDAPPPWNSINGELTVNPGDRYQWPIRSG